MTTYQLKIEVLSPLHIGDGGKLKRDIDFVTQGNWTYVLHMDRFAHWAYDTQETQSDRWMELLPGELLDGIDISKLGISRYRLRGETTQSELRTFEKNGLGQPYIAGSSIKGMLRTIFIWGLYAAQGTDPDLQRLNRSRSFAAQPVERSVIGADPSHDLFRAFRIRDSQPLPKDDLRVLAVDIYPTAHQSGRGVVVNVEALSEGQIIETELNVEDYGFSSDVSGELGWKGKSSWLTPATFVPLAKTFSEIRLQQELAYFESLDDARVVRSFYRTELVKRHNNLQDNQFLAQIGWGTGWNSKTLNDLLLKNPAQFADLVRQYRLTRNSNTFTPQTPFPKSRQLVRVEGQPVRPLGWILVTVL